MVEETYIPLYHLDDEFPDHFIFYTENRIDRDYMIWVLGKTGNLTFKQIGQFVGCSESCAGTAYRRVLAVGNEKDILEYFHIGFDLHDIILEHGGNPNKQIMYILNAMLRAGLMKRSRVKNLTIAKMKQFLAQRDLHNSGEAVKEAFKEYRYRLKHHKLYYDDREGGSYAGLEKSDQIVRGSAGKDHNAGHGQRSKAEA